MGKPDSGKYMLWLDLETTGTDERSGDEIIEVGVALTDRDLNVIEEQNWVVCPEERDSILTMDDVVIDMHVKSGLLGDVIKAMKQGVNTISEVDNRLSEMLFKYNGTRRTPLAGSGVMHFDRRFIKKYMPETDRKLTFWAYDVGAVRRFFKIAGLEDPSDFEGLKHRALDDVHDHIAEAKVYIELMKTMVSSQ
jgi:oligoribonuclease